MPIDFSRFRPGLSAGAALSLALALAGCAGGGTPVTLAPDSNWGEANRQTMAAQIVNPAPHYDSDMAEGSGDQAAMAVARYRTGRVKQPDQVHSSTVVSGGSSAGASAH